MTPRSDNRDLALARASTTALATLAMLAASCLSTDGDRGVAARGDTNEKRNHGDAVVFSTWPEPAGANCPYGGTALASGGDADKNGELDSAEIESIQYICNGTPGDDGDPGEDGAQGEDGYSTLISSSSAAPGAACPAGGAVLSWGRDFDRDNVLDASEVEGADYVCDGANGVNGQDGRLALVVVTPLASGADCSYGGALVHSGVDDDGDGVLEAFEIDHAGVVCNGAPGADGSDGADALVTTSDEAAGANCPHGGQRIDAGTDRDGSGMLDAGEITRASYVCNGAPGADGEDGLSSLMSSADEPPGAMCPAGGTRLSWGRDLDRDNVLDAGEVEGLDYVCDGADGAAGVDGIAGLVDVAPLPAGAECPNGGALVQSGLDLDADGVLDLSEIGRSAVVCNGAPGADGAAGLSALITTSDEPAGSACPAGGQRILSGIDVDGDGVLGVGEITRTAFVCNGADGQDGSSGDGDVLLRILVTPANPLIELDVDQTSTQAFTATAQYRDAGDVDISLNAVWRVENPNIGLMAGNTLHVPAFGVVDAQTSLVTATYEGIEGHARVTVVAHHRSGEQQELFFVLPYLDGDGPKSQPLSFGTAIQSLDVFFLMDTTASMGGVLANLKFSLMSSVIPQLRSQILDTQVGVGQFRDFPIGPYGDAGDQPFTLVQTIAAPSTEVQTRVNEIVVAGGNDGPESGLEGLYQVATGDGLSGPSPTHVAPNHMGIGGVGFRAGSMPVVVHMTDTISHTKDEPNNTSCGGDTEYQNAAVKSSAHTRIDVKNALDAICARVIGVPTVAPVATDCDGRADLTDLAIHTGAQVSPAAWDLATRPAGCGVGQCCTGINGAGVPVDGNGLCPLVFQVSSSGTGLGSQLVSGVQMLTRFAAFDAATEIAGGSTDLEGYALPGGSLTTDFVRAVTPVRATVPVELAALPAPSLDATTFFDVTPGTELELSVIAFNDIVEPTDHAQLFRVVARSLADGCMVLDQRDILILVPPNPTPVE